MFDLYDFLSFAIIFGPMIFVALHCLFRRGNEARKDGDTFDHSAGGSAYNINGLPMVGGTDINGNPYGTM